MVRVASDPSVAVVVSDLRMPGMDGIALLRKLREERPDVLRILLTGNADLRVATDAINACGVFKLMLNPSPPGQLEAAIRSALERHDFEMKTQSLALEDYLLEIGNRRALDRALPRVHGLAKRYGRPYGLAMADVDAFKHYNDSFGHLAGDQALVSIAQAIRSTCRGSDEAFRYGGEEIVLLFPDTPAEGVTVACERVRQRVEALAIPHPNHDRDRLTISIGASCYDGREACEPQVILQRADRALYQSKAAGKNRVTFWPSATP